MRRSVIAPALLHLDVLLIPAHAPILCSLIHRCFRTQTRLESWQVLTLPVSAPLELNVAYTTVPVAALASTTRSRSTSTRKLRSAVSLTRGKEDRRRAGKTDSFCRTAIQDIGSALQWLRSTFLFVRITKNCAFYGLGTDTASPEQRLEEICLRAVDQLVQSGIVEREEDTLVANRTYRCVCLDAMVR